MLDQETLNILLDEVDMAYYESGAYYDISREPFEEKYIQNLEDKYQFCYIEF